jgi:Tetratricopeptide repeat
VVGGRVPKIDKETLTILSEEALIVYLNYLDQLKALYTLFVHQNFNAGKKVSLVKHLMNI